MKIFKHPTAVAAMLVSLLAGAAGCERPVRLVDARTARIEDSGTRFNRYSERDKQLIRRGSFRVGLDEYALYLARGKPAFYWHTLAGNKWCRVLLYGSNPKEPVADMAVYTCGGTIVHWAKVEPALPCWRLTGVAPRITADLRYFQRRPLREQWGIVAGILRRGLAKRDVAIAFGKPYNSGVEAREDGTNATTQVFLDNTGEAYGLYLTFVQDRLVGWRIPARRMLTPEAQARRLKATEQRLMAQLKRMEARSIKRHRAQMRLLNELQTSQDDLFGQLAQRPMRAVRRHLGLPSSGTGGPGVRYTNRRRQVSGSRKLTINGCTYEDSPTGNLGRPCSGQKPCPGGYSCQAMTAGSSTSGVCVPSDQVGNCGN
jgi:hypothetical protein